MIAFFSGFGSATDCSRDVVRRPKSTLGESAARYGNEFNARIVNREPRRIAIFND